MALMRKVSQGDTQCIVRVVNLGLNIYLIFYLLCFLSGCIGCFIFNYLRIPTCTSFACGLTAHVNVSFVCICAVFLSRAGTERHELTSWMSFVSIFRFFSEVLEAKEDEEAEETSNTVTTRSSSLKIKHQDL